MNLEEHIEEASEKIGVNLVKHETTPGGGNCWYEACVCLMKLNNMRTMTAKQLRRAVVENIENCPNFAYVFEMIFKCDQEKLEEFKKKHIKEGEYTDLDGVMTLATAYYLGVTLRIFSRTNSKKNPYTEHNPNQMIIFNVFLDDRSSGHFQSLLQPDRSSEEIMQDWYDRFVNTEQEVYKPKLQISVGRLENSMKVKKPTEKINIKNDKASHVTVKENKKQGKQKVKKT